MTRTTDFNNKVIDRFVDSITDRVFLMIQEDRDLMLEYLRLISDSTLDDVNKSLGKAVRQRLNLENDSIEVKEVKSTLIKSYTRHKIIS